MLMQKTYPWAGQRRAWRRAGAAGAGGGRAGAGRRRRRWCSRRAGGSATWRSARPPPRLTTAGATCPRTHTSFTSHLQAYHTQHSDQTNPFYITSSVFSRTIRAGRQRLAVTGWCLVRPTFSDGDGCVRDSTSHSTLQYHHYNTISLRHLPTSKSHPKLSRCLHTPLRSNPLFFSPIIKPFF